MDQATFDNYVKSRYQDQIDWYDRKAIENQRAYKRLQMLTIVSSSLTPVILVAHFVVGHTDYSNRVNWLALITSAVAAFSSMALKNFKYEDKYFNYRGTCELLRGEIYLYQAGTGEYKTAADPRALFVEKIEGLISREHAAFQSLGHIRREEAAGG